LSRVDERVGERFGERVGERFSNTYSARVHSFIDIPLISRYPTHFPISIKSGFKETSG
jgi:hypothetical protein